MKSFLKFLSRNKFFTAIEAAGLAVSLAFVILIGSFIVQQHQVARENPDWKRIYGLCTDNNFGLGFLDKEELDMHVPEVELAARFQVQQTSVVGFEGQKLGGVVDLRMGVDPEFFEMFSYLRWLEGTPASFRSKDDVVLSESMARMLADRTGKDPADLVGLPIVVGEHPCQIVGIIQDFRESILTQVDLLTHIEVGRDGRERNFNSIGGIQTLYRVRPDVSREVCDAKVDALTVKNYSPDWKDAPQNWHPMRIDEIFWNEGFRGNSVLKTGNRQMVRLMTIVVLLLLLSAIFNYINLSFALGGKRAKEMATRRLLGSDRSDILWKHIGESVAFTALCFAVALVLARLLTPMMNGLLAADDIQHLETSVKMRVLLTPGYLVAYGAAILVLGAFCGLLPAWAASRYEPIDVIKGTLRRKSKMVFSKVFIVAQNVLAVFLIAMSFVMEVQMRHMQDRPTHSQVENRYYLDFYALQYDQMRLLKDKVERLPFVTAVGVGRNIPGIITMSQTLSLPDGTSHQIPCILADTTYFKLLGLEVVEDFNHPLMHSVWVDETVYQAAHLSDTTTVFPRMFGLNGARIEYLGGVVRDFPAEAASDDHMKTRNGAVLVNDPKDMFYAHALLIATVGEDPDYDRQIMKAYEEYRFEQYGVYETPWRHGFLRDIYRDQLQPVRRTMRLLELFAVLSVLIALLGLLAMSAYYAGENTKQIAVRKVFGADVKGETWRNVKSYMVMAGIACVIAIPLAVWAARLYLQRFPYRIENYGWVFAAAVAIGIVIAFATVLWQTAKAAKADPAVELKKE
ncbi:MAG: FtsX-like permease family protein [Bacteroidales bacterium]|nr:FtsX-like permease family protein [Bacteroidales bacterium]